MADQRATGSVVNSVAETTLTTLAVPTTLVDGDVLHFVIAGDQLNNSGAGVNYTYRVKLGATEVLRTEVTSFAANADRRRFVIEGTILVATPASDQRLAARLEVGVPRVGSPDPWGQPSTSGSTTAGYGTAAEDLTVAKDLTFTVQLGTAVATADCIVRMATLEVVGRGKAG